MDQGSSQTKPNKNRQAMREVWLDKTSYATTLVLCYIDTYGTEGLEWDPSTIRSEIEDDYGVKLSTLNFNKLMAGISVIQSDQFYQSLPDFIHLCNVLNGDILDPRWFDPADPSECAWGITETMFLSPPEREEENPFSQDIVTYIAEAVKAHGIHNPPDVLRVGLRADADQIAENVAQTFSDDPIMYSAIWKNQQEKSDEIREYVKSNLRTLLGQLNKLQLSNGNVVDAVKKMTTSN